MASKIDPNVYSLSIQLALESSDAFESLDVFTGKITDLEEQVSSAAQKSMSSIGSVATAVIQNIEDIGGAFAKVQATTLKVQTNLEDATKEIKDQFDTGEEQLDNIQEIHDLLEKIQKINIKMGKELDDHLKMNDSFLKGVNEVVKAVELKNTAHREQNELISNDVNLVQAVNAQLETTRQKIVTNDRAWRMMQSTLKSIWHWIKTIDQDTEKFVATNYRAYGSQQQLLQGARNLSMEQGVFYDKAVETYAILGDLKVPREELAKYAKIVAIASRTTGVAVQVAAEYVNRLRTAGLSAMEAERNVGHMTEAMRKFGLNTRDVNALMAQSAANTKNAARIFGAGAEEMKKWEESRVIMAGFAREVGMGAEELAGFENWILNDVSALERFKALTNTVETGVDGYRLAMLRAGLETNRQMEVIEADIVRGVDRTAELKAVQEALIKTYYGGSRAAYESARAMGKSAKQAGVTGASIGELDKFNQQAARSMENQLGNANDTFIAQLNILKSTIFSLVGSALQPFAVILGKLAKVLNLVGSIIGWMAKGLQFVTGIVQDLANAVELLLTPIVWLVEKVKGLIDLLEGIPVLGKIITIIKAAIAFVVALAIGFVFLSAGLATFATVTAGASSVMAGAAKVMASIGAAMVQMATYIGQSIIIVLTSMGQGLAALGNAIRPVIVPLLALGAALLMAGLGAYFFVQAIVTLTNVGLAAIPAIFGLLAAITAMGIILIGLGMLIQGPIAVGLLVLSGAFLAVGLASMMVGVGLYIAAMAIEMLSESLGFGLIIKLGLLGLVLLGFAALAMAAIPGLLALAAVMAVLAISSLLLGLAMEVIATSMTMLPDPGTLLLYAVGFAAVGLAFFFAGGLLMGAALLFTAAAPMLLVASGMLLAAGMAMIPAGLALLVAGTILLVSSAIFLIGTAILFTAATLMFASGSMIFGGAVMMLGGAGLLIEGAGLLMVAGPLLLIAGLLLWLGLLFLGGPAEDIYEIGLQIGMGGMMLMMGAQFIIIAAQMLTESAGFIDTSLTVLEGITPRLFMIAGMLRPAGFAMLMGGLYLIGAVAILAEAGDELVYAAQVLLFGTFILGMALAILTNIGLALVAVSVLFVTAAIFMLVAGMLFPIAASLILGAMDVLIVAGIESEIAADWLTSGSYRLINASDWLVDAAFALMSAGHWLVPASFAIYIGLRWLEFAIERFSKTIDAVEKIAKAVTLLANSFQQLHNTPLDALNEMADKSLEAIPKVERLGKRLVGAAAILQEGVNKFRTPAEELAVIFERLGTAMASFSAMSSLGDDVAKMSTMLDQYANLLEGATERIETAINTRALPAMKAAESAGIEETVRSEAISTVQVMDMTEGGPDGESERLLEIQMKQVDLLESLDNRLASMEASGDLGDILGLLQTYLPSLTKADSGLGSELNMWAR